MISYNLWEFWNDKDKRDTNNTYAIITNIGNNIYLPESKTYGYTHIN